MIRTPVTSSNVVSIGYDSPTMTLEVEFKGAAVYQVADVDRQQHQAFMDSNSKGSFYATYFRNNERHGVKRVAA